MKNIIPLCLSLQNQLQTWHWQSESFAQHEAFGKTYSGMSDIIDEFVEVYVGAYWRESIEDCNFSVKTVDIKNTEPQTVVDAYIEMFNEEVMKDIHNNTELVNIKDEIVGVLRKLKYLLTMN